MACPRVSTAFKLFAHLLGNFWYNEHLCEVKRDFFLVWMELLQNGNALSKWQEDLVCLTVVVDSVGFGAFWSAHWYMNGILHGSKIVLFPI